MLSGTPLGWHLHPPSSRSLWSSASSRPSPWGWGVSFLIFGLPLVRRVSADSKLRAWLMYLGFGWALVSWWPHGNLHMSNGDNMQRLLYIEYGFHVTLVISAAIVAYCFLSLLRERSDSTAPPLG